MTHPLHDPARAWPETNCYVDLWIELLHSRGLDPLACMGFTVSTDFEGDQWTFFKPPFADLYELYGADVQELTIWRDLLDHVRQQVERGRVVLVEVDSFHLPDTHATDYRKNHSKTTIAIDEIDEQNKRLSYFHNAVRAELGGDDWAELFERRPLLPPYAELVKFNRMVRRSREETTAMAARILARELGRLPANNPLTAFRTKFPADATWLFERDLAAFHAYAFATIRQLGACFELAREHLLWLDSADRAHVDAAAQFQIVSDGAKALLFKIARMVNTKKKASFDETLASMEAAWAAGMELVRARHGG